MIHLTTRTVDSHRYLRFRPPPMAITSTVTCSTRPTLPPPSSKTRHHSSSSNRGVGEMEKGRVIRVSDSLRDAGRMILDLSSLSPLLAEENSGSGGGGVEDDRQKYYVNLGYAIRTLREELPVIFYREPSFDIFRDDIVFKTRVISFSGIENYKLIFWAIRLYARIFFKTLWLEIVSVWQPVDDVIMVRWAVHGVPRLPWESQRRFDGNSEYKFDKNGKIYEHRVDTVLINSPPAFRVFQVEDLILSLGCPSTPKPTCFETLSSFLISYILHAHVVRVYMDEVLTGPSLNSCLEICRTRMKFSHHP